MCNFTKSFSFWGTAPLDPAGRFPSPRPPVFFYVPPNNPVRSTPLFNCQYSSKVLLATIHKHCQFHESMRWTHCVCDVSRFGGGPEVRFLRQCLTCLRTHEAVVRRQYHEMNAFIKVAAVTHQERVELKQIWLEMVCIIGSLYQPVALKMNLTQNCLLCDQRVYLHYHWPTSSRKTITETKQK